MEIERKRGGCGTHHIVGSDEVLESQGSSESGIERKRIGIDNVEQTQRVLRLCRFLLQSSLGWVCLLATRVAGQRGTGRGARSMMGTFAVLGGIESCIEQLRDVTNIGGHDEDR